MSFNADFFAEIYAKAQQKDRAFLAKMRLADNPKLGDRVFSVLARHGISLNPCIRLPYMILGASAARMGAIAEGKLSLGKALRKAFKNKELDDPNLQIRLRRLVACDSSAELCRILPATLRLVESRLEVGDYLNYEKIFKLIALFDINLTHARSVLVQEFYGGAARPDDLNQQPEDVHE